MGCIEGSWWPASTDHPLLVHECVSGAQGSRCTVVYHLLQWAETGLFFSVSDDYSELHLFHALSNSSSMEADLQSYLTAYSLHNSQARAGSIFMCLLCFYIMSYRVNTWYMLSSYWWLDCYDCCTNCTECCTRNHIVSICWTRRQQCRSTPVKIIVCVWGPCTTPPLFSNYF